MLFYDFLLKTITDRKVRAAKDHGKKFRSRPAASFSGIVNCETVILMKDSCSFYYYYI